MVGMCGTSARATAIDLFCGAGGLSLGLELAGVDVVLGVENDPVHAAVHHYNFPHAAVAAGSVENFTGDELLARAGVDEVDVVVGGPPCQGFSLIGRRIVDDPRNQLLRHYGRLVREIRPRYFVMENVPGMLLGEHTSVLEALIDYLEDDGAYKCAEPVVVDAADYGVPQHRRRVLLMGWRSDQDPVAVPSATHGPAGDAPYVTVGQALRGMPDLSLLPELHSRPTVRLDGDRRQMFRTMDARRKTDPPYVDYLRDRDDAALHRRRVWDPKLLTCSRLTRHTPQTVARYERLPQGATEPSHRHPRLEDVGLCPTLRAGSGRDHGAHTSPRPIHPHEPRVITVREAARLHGFPDWFRLHDTKWHGFRQIGNAVAPPLGRAIGEVLVDRLGTDPQPAAEAAEGDRTLLGLTVTHAAQRLGARLDDVPVNVRSGRNQRVAAAG